jgi:hypothetical protein
MAVTHRQHPLAHPIVMLARRTPWGVIAWCLYSASLILPAASTSGSGSAIPGIYCLLLGWVVIVPWSANLMLGIAALLRSGGRHRGARVGALLAVALASTTHFFVPEFTVGVGFVAWISSMVALAFASTRSLAEQCELRRPLAAARAVRLTR